MPSRKDMTGLTFGRLKVIKIHEPINPKRIMWECVCECGQNMIACGRQLRNGHTKSCGCFRRDELRKLRWLGTGEVSGWYLSELKCRSKSKNTPFNLTTEFLWELFLKQDKKCALSGLPLTLTYNSKSKIRGSGSIDRIDSTKGYTMDNVQWVHKDVNYMKQEYKQEYFLYLCKRITENMNT